MTTMQELLTTSDFPIDGTRRSIEDRIEALIAMLDIVDDDVDLEPDLDAEPGTWTESTIARVPVRC